MTDSSERSPAALPGALAFALCFALFDLLAREALHVLLGGPGGLVYQTSALAGVGLVTLLALPIGLVYGADDRGPGRIAGAGTLAALAASAHALAFAVHAETGHLPGSVIDLRAAFADPSIRESLFTSALVAGALVAMASLAASPTVERILSARFESPATRTSDLLVVGTVALIGAGTMFGAAGPGYYGGAPPTLHALFGSRQDHVEPPAAPEHEDGDDGHDGHDHAHHHRPRTADRMGAERDPLPPDGIPHPPRDWREAIWDLMGVEAPTPLSDIRYPYCREGAPVRDTDARLRPVLMLGIAGGTDADIRAVLGESYDEAARFERLDAAGESTESAAWATMGGLAPWLLNLPMYRAPYPRIHGLGDVLTQAGYRALGFVGQAHAAGAEARVMRAAGFTLRTSSTPGPETDAARAFLTEEGTFPRAALVRVDLRAAEGRESAAAGLPELVAAARAAGALVVVYGETASLAEGEGEDALTAAATGTTRVPFALVGGPDVTDEDRQRLGGLIDLPQTVLGALGLRARGCFQGRDLTGHDEAWPEHRHVWTYLRAQDAHVVHEGSLEWTLRGEVHATPPPGPEGPGVRLFSVAEGRLYDLALDPERRNDLFDPRDRALRLVRKAVGVGSAILRYAITQDRLSLVGADAHAPIARAAADDAHTVVTLDQLPEGGLEVPVAIGPGASVHVLTLEGPTWADAPAALRARARRIRILSASDPETIVSSLRDALGAQLDAVAVATDEPAVVELLASGGLDARWIVPQNARRAEARYFESARALGARGVDISAGQTTPQTTALARRRGLRVVYRIVEDAPRNAANPDRWVLLTRAPAAAPSAPATPSE